MSCLPTLAGQLCASYPLLNLNGMLSSSFVVQYSTDLAGANWMNLLSLSLALAVPARTPSAGQKMA